ncbi:MAG: nicotinamide riboside transporter PnuC [Porticoccaceae bacterium]
MFEWLGLETVAVLLGIAYLLFAMRENSLCWYCAFISTGIYIWIFGDVSLYMESALNAYYMVMAVYGWYQWQRGGSSANGIKLSVWGIKQHMAAIGLVLILSVVSGYLLSQNTEARMPYIDSFTTWGSVITTFMVARKVLENWLYWIVINSVAIFLYIDRDLYQTAGLYALYIILSVIGFIAWRKAYFQQSAESS